MNIAFFDAAPYWSGGAQRVYFCCRELKKRGFNIILFCYSTSRLNYLLKDTVKIYNIKPFSDLDLFALIKIAKILYKNKINILDVHSPKFYWICLLLSKLFNKKFILTRNVVYRKKGLKKVINKLLYNNCAHIISVSEKVKQIICEDFGIEKNKITTIYDCIDKKEPFKNAKDVRIEIRQYYNVDDETFLLAVISRIEKTKGHDLVLKSVKMLVDKKIKVKLIVVGAVEDNVFYDKLKRYVKGNDLEDQIFFIGFKDDVENYILASDIIVSGSYSESMGKSLLEGLLYNKPFVATKVGGLAEIVPKNCGVFVEVGNFEALVSGILKIVSNYNFYVENIDRMDKEIFSIDKMVNEYEKIYKRVLNEK